MTSTPRLLTALLTASVLIAGCGGGGAALQPAAIPSAGGTTANSRGSIALRITIPKATTSAANTRRPAYISASTQSLAINVMQGATSVLQQAVALTTTANPNCTASGSVTTCYVILGLSSGSYTGTFAMYDGPVVSNAATGNLLSQGQALPIAVTAGQTNTVAITLDGVPASITVTPAGGSQITGTLSGGLTLRHTAQSLLIEALDADGNTIVGPGAPTFTAQTTGSGFTLTPPGTATPNQIMLASTGSTAGTLTVTVVPPPDNGFSCTTAGVVCTASGSIAPPPHMLYVANASSLSVYASTDDATWTLLTTNATGVTQPRALAVAPDGTAFIAEDGFINASQYVVEYPSPYTGTPITITSGYYPNPVAMAVSPSGALVVAGSAGFSVLPSPWTGAATPTLVGGNGGASQIAFDGAGNALFGDTGDPLASFAPPAYTSSTNINPTTTSGPIAVGPDGTTLFSGNSTNGVNVYTPPYSNPPVLLTLPGGPPWAPIVDANGHFWVVANPVPGLCPCNQDLFEYAPPFTPTSTPTFTQVYTPTLISHQVLAADSSGHVILPSGNTSLAILNESGATVGTISAGIQTPIAIVYVR